MEQMNGKKNFIEALPDIAIILDKTTAFDEITMLSLISTLINIAAAQALGIHGIQFFSAEQAQQAFHALEHA